MMLSESVASCILPSLSAIALANSCWRNFSCSSAASFAASSFAFSAASNSFTFS